MCPWQCARSAQREYSSLTTWRGEFLRTVRGKDDLLAGGRVYAQGARPADHNERRVALDCQGMVVSSRWVSV